MLTLAINTSSFTESVALFTKKKILAELSWRGKSDESEKFLPAILKILKRAGKKWSDLKRIIIVNGPGPFSAVRIGVTTANVIGLALKIPVFSISSEKFWRLRKPKKNAVLLLHAGGNFVAIHKNRQKPALCKITNLSPSSPLTPHPSPLFYGDLIPDELKELRKQKNMRFIPENYLKSFSETIFNVKLSLLKKEKSATPLYWRPPNITKPKNV